MAPQSSPSNVNSCTTPQSHDSRMAGRKNKPVAHFFVVLLLAIVTTLIHLRSARFIIPASNGIAENHQIPMTLTKRNNNKNFITESQRQYTVQNSTDVLVERGAHADNTITNASMAEFVNNATYTINVDSNQTAENNTKFWQDLSNEQRKRLAKKLRRMSPIVAAGLPKTGTTSLHKYFASLHKASIFRSSHTFTTLANGTKPRAGACMQDNLVNGRKMLHGCGRFHVWSDSGYAKGGNCFYPLWHALDEFAEQYPHATIILNTRNATQWTASIQNWAKGSLAKRWTKCRNAPALPKNMKEKKWISFYNKYHDRIRKVCKTHATLKCIEFDISDANAGTILEANFGIPASHWRNCNPRDFTCIQAG